MISWITLRFDPAAISGRLSGAAKHTRYSGPSFSSILGWAGVQISANKFWGFFLGILDFQDLGNYLSGEAERHSGGYPGSSLSSMLGWGRCANIC